MELGGVSGRLVGGCDGLVGGFGGLVGVSDGLIGVSDGLGVSWGGGIETVCISFSADVDTAVGGILGNGEEGNCDGAIRVEVLVHESIEVGDRDKDGFGGSVTTIGDSGDG